MIKNYIYNNKQNTSNKSNINQLKNFNIILTGLKPNIPKLKTNPLYSKINFPKPIKCLDIFLSTHTCALVVIKKHSKI